MFSLSGAAPWDSLVIFRMGNSPSVEQMCLVWFNNFFRFFCSAEQFSVSLSVRLDAYFSVHSQAQLPNIYNTKPKTCNLVFFHKEELYHFQDLCLWYAFPVAHYALLSYHCS
jgi:hypothetical protein